MERARDNSVCSRLSASQSGADARHGRLPSSNGRNADVYTGPNRDTYPALSEDAFTTKHADDVFIIIEFCDGKSRHKAALVNTGTFLYGKFEVDVVYWIGPAENGADSYFDLRRDFYQTRGSDLATNALTAAQSPESRALLDAAVRDCNMSDWGDLSGPKKSIFHVHTPNFYGRIWVKP